MIREVDRTNPIILKSPGNHRVTIYKDGYVQFDKDMTDLDKELICEISQEAINMLPKDAKPIEAFKLMGWIEET